MSRIRLVRRSRLVAVSTRLPTPANDAAPAPSPDLEVMIVEELATLLRVSVKHAYDLCGAGQVPGATKVGAAPGSPSGVWRIHRPTVVAWLSGQIGVSRPRKGRR